MSSEEQRRLEELLDAAGRAAQPTVFGWETLPARLAQTPQKQPWRLGRWGTLPLGVAAAAVLLALWLGGPLGERSDATGPIEVRRQGVDLTILSVAETDGETLYMPIVNLVGRRLLAATAPAGGTVRLWQMAEEEYRDALSRRARRARSHTGQALVRDRRLVLNLKQGDNIVRFTDVAASLDPTSVRFESRTDPLGTRVVEQGFEYDLAAADTLLERYLDREVTCVAKDGAEHTGRLVSFDAGSVVLLSGGNGRATESLSRRSLRALRLGALPDGLVTRPTLVWRLRAQKPGKHETVLTYICGLIGWHADYVVHVTPGDGKRPDTLDFAGWVTVQNTSGSTYPDAGLRLIAGDLNRLRDPWAVAPPERQNALGRLGDDDRDSHLAGRGVLQAKALTERSFFEYHLYALSDPTTVRDRQVKQLRLLQKKGVKATRRYVYDPDEDTRRVTVTLLVKNDKDNQLGAPLPKGNVVLEQRGGDGEAAVIGRTAIDHTAVKEELELRYACAFDVVGSHRELAVEYPEVDVRRTTYELRVRSHKKEPIEVRAFARRLGRYETLAEATADIRRKDAFTTHFDFTLAPNGEQVIRYTIEKVLCGDE